MRRHPKFKLILEDESRLKDIFNIKMSRGKLACLVLAYALLSFVVAGTIIISTPLKTLLPGYMKSSERSASEENILRLDSIHKLYQSNQTFFNTIVRALDTERVPEDSIVLPTETREMTSDSLLPASPAERKFVSTMEERERYNLSVLAPLAAEDMMFSPVSDSGIFTSSSRNENEGEVLMVADEVVRSIADGAVLCAYYSPPEKGYIILLQHPRGFISRYAGLGSPMVSTGDNVISGQMISLAPNPDAKLRRTLRIRMWHNGTALIPFEYIGVGIGSTPAQEKYEDPRGR